GADPARLSGWIAAAGLDSVLNRSGTTFRKLPDADKAGVDTAKAVALMVAQPSLIRRPIVEYPGGLLIGFREAVWVDALGA
ncbi:ArsC/Spx/MgsR family protein, partial [Salmonella enterica]|uniref:ArsC/Spx/MgsR family protein n=1 Tax=Salmonella enterica TaxID=28901 RepID=UPI003D2C01B9